MNKPFRGTIEQWKTSPTPGFGLGYLIRGQILMDSKYSDLRSHTGYVVFRGYKPDRVETVSGMYLLGKPFDEPVPYDENDYDAEKGLSQWEATVAALI